MVSLHCLSNFAIQLLVYWQLAPIQQHAHVVQLTKRYLPMLPAFNEGTEMLEKTSLNVVSINQTSRMERLVLCACVGPQRTLGAPGEGAISGSCARRMKAVSFARAGQLFSTLCVFEF